MLKNKTCDFCLCSETTSLTLYAAKQHYLAAVSFTLSPRKQFCFAPRSVEIQSAPSSSLSAFSPRWWGRTTRGHQTRGRPTCQPSRRSSRGQCPPLRHPLSNNDLLAGVEIVLHAENPVSADEDKDDNGHAPVRDPHCILQFLLLDLLDACICLSQALSNVNLFFSYPSTLFIEVLKSFPLNGLVHRNQIFVCIRSNRLVPVVNVFQ